MIATSFIIPQESWKGVSNVRKLFAELERLRKKRHTECEKLATVPQIFLIIEWPSKDVARTFYGCDEYRPYRQSRIEGAKSEFLLVAGEDMTKTAQIAD